MNEIDKLKQLVKRIRREAITSIYKAQSGHPGSSLSIADILTVLYFGGVLKHDPKNPSWEERDIFILSNGHAVPGLYSALAVAGFYPVEKLDGLRKIDTPMHGHPKRGTFPGIEVSSGSLGQGLSVGIGIALGFKLKKKQNKVFVMMSDGEQEEGSVWEAAMFAPKYNLTNLVAIVDKNGNQINGPTKEVMPGLDPLADKYRAFNWDVIEIDGHNFDEIIKAFKKATKATKPTVIISHSVTGKGVSYMEGNYHWHHGKLTKEQYKKAMEDLT